MLTRCHRLTAIFLVLLLPASLLAADTGAVVRSYAGVRVNGVAAISGFTVFDGDTVQTRLGSPATISSNGNVVVLAGDSGLRYSNSEIELTNGSATINTTRGMRSTVTGVSIRPTSNSAKYEIIQSDKEIVVGARQGTVEIADASGTLLLKQGMAATIVPQAPVPASSASAPKNSQSTATTDDQEKERRKRRGAAPIPASTQGAATAGVSHAKMYAIIGGIVGAGAFIGLQAMRGDSSPTCPSNATCP